MDNQDWGATDALAFARFWQLATGLKQLRRQGWIDRGVGAPESAADHSWGVALLGWMLAGQRPELDRDRVLLLGLIHDLPEALAGDATPFDVHRDATGTIDARRFRDAPRYDSDQRRAKQAAEEAALARLLDPLDDATRDELRTLWHEYEDGLTPEARFVRQVDKLETLLQAEDYASVQPGLVIDSFRIGTRRDVTDRQLRVLVDIVSPEG